MWWSRRLLLLGLLGLFGPLAACGFEPLYGQRSAAGGSAAAELATIRILPIADRTGQLLYNELRDRLNPRGKPASPRYILTILLEESKQELALRGDETATRANLNITATYELRRSVSESGSDNDEMVTSGLARITTAYDILQSQFSTLVSIEDARARSVRALGDDIQTRLAVALSPRSAAAP